MAGDNLEGLDDIGALALDDLLYAADTSDGYRSRNVTPGTVLGAAAMPPGGRLTLTSGSPFTAGDVGGATAIYYTPFVSNLIQLYDDVIGRWQAIQFAEYTLPLGTLTSGLPYDVFAYLSGGVLALEMADWTDDTTRQFPVSWFQGRLIKDGDPTRLLLGTFYTTSTTATEDSAAKRYLANIYNARPKYMRAPPETENSWVYSTATDRQAFGNAANQLNLLVSYPFHEVHAEVLAVVGSSGTADPVKAGIALDATNTNHAWLYGALAGATAQQVRASYRSQIAAGRHYLAWIERGAGSNTQTWYGDNGGSHMQSGIIGSIYV